MKKIKHLYKKTVNVRFKLILLVITFFLTNNVFCQAPQGFNYQAIIREPSGEIKANSAVTIQINIIQGSATGSSVFKETHSTGTNDFGLANLIIGSVETKTFSVIDWASGPYFVKISVDGQEMGVTQLLSVPYALYAASGVGSTGPRGEQGPQGEKGDQGPQGPATTDATLITEGVLNTLYYSAYDDLNDENRLDNNHSDDILTREQSDNRYNKDLSFMARNTGTDHYTEGTLHKVEFNETAFNNNNMYRSSNDRYIAFTYGIYHFSTSVRIDDLAIDREVVLKCHVNGAAYCNLASGYANNQTVTLCGSVNLQLSPNDYVEIWVYSTDTDISVTGSTEFMVTHFSGQLINRQY